MVDIIGIDMLFKDIDEWLDKTDEKVQGSTRHAISLTVNELGGRVRANLTSTDLNINSPMPEGGTLYEGISQYMWKKETIPNVSVGVINILGTREENDGTWRLRFFEGGTRPRVSETGKYLGTIQPRWFFDKATSDVDTVLRKNIDACLDQALRDNR